MRNKLFILKPISVILIVALLWQNIVWANPEISQKKTASRTLQVPSKFLTPEGYLDLFVKAIVQAFNPEELIDDERFKNEIKYRLRPLYQTKRYGDIELFVDFDNEDESEDKHGKYQDENGNWIVPCYVGYYKKDRFWQHDDYEAVIPPDKDISLRKLGEKLKPTAVETDQPKLEFRERKLVDYGVYTEAELSNRKALYREFKKEKDISSLSAYEKVFVWQYMILMKLDQSQNELFKTINSEFEISANNGIYEIDGLYIGLDWPGVSEFETPAPDKIDTFQKNLTIGPGDKLLDVGCGDGKFVISLAEAHPEAQLVAGIDANPYSISQAINTIIDMGESAPKNIKFHIRDCRGHSKRDKDIPNRGIPYGNDTFDIVTLFEGVLDYADYKNPKQQLLIWKEVVKVTKKDGGRVVFYGLRGRESFRRALPKGIDAKRQSKTLFSIGGELKKSYTPYWANEYTYKKKSTKLYIWKLNRKRPATKSKPAKQGATGPDKEKPALSEVLPQSPPQAEDVAKHPQGEKPASPAVDIDSTYKAGPEKFSFIKLLRKHSSFLLILTISLLVLLGLNHCIGQYILNSADKLYVVVDSEELIETARQYYESWQTQFTNGVHVDLFNPDFDYPSAAIHFDSVPEILMKIYTLPFIIISYNLISPICYILKEDGVDLKHEKYIKKLWHISFLFLWYGYNLLIADALKWHGALDYLEKWAPGDLFGHYIGRRLFIASFLLLSFDFFTSIIKKPVSYVRTRIRYASNIGHEKKEKPPASKTTQQSEKEKTPLAETEERQATTPDKSTGSINVKRPPEDKAKRSRGTRLIIAFLCSLSPLLMGMKPEGEIGLLHLALFVALVALPEVIYLIGSFIIRRKHSAKAKRPQGEKPKPTAPETSEQKKDEWDPANGEVLQFNNADGIWIAADHGGGKSFLAIKLIENDERWKVVSCGDARIKLHEINGKKVLLGKRITEDNLLYSRLLGKKRVELSEENVVPIRWIIALDDSKADFLKNIMGSGLSAEDLGITVIEIGDLDVGREYEEALQRINNSITANSTEPKPTAPKTTQRSEKKETPPAKEEKQSPPAQDKPETSPEAERPPDDARLVESGIPEKFRKTEEFFDEVREHLIKKTKIPEGVIRKISNEEIEKIIDIVEMEDKVTSKSKKIKKIEEILLRFSLGRKNIQAIINCLKDDIYFIIFNLIVDELISEKIIKDTLDANKWTSDRKEYGIGEGRVAVRKVLSKIINDILNRYLSDSDRTIIDVGAGEGWLATIIDKKWTEEGRYIPFDINPNFLAKIMKKGLCKKTIEGNVYELSKHVKGVDAIIASDSYDTFEDLKKAARESYETLKPGGKMILFQTVRADSKLFYEEMKEEGIVYCPEIDAFFSNKETFRKVMRPYIRAYLRNKLGDINDNDFYEYMELRKIYDLDITPIYHSRLVEALKSAEFNILQEGIEHETDIVDREDRHNVIHDAVGLDSMPEYVNRISYKYGNVTTAYFSLIPKGKLAERAVIYVVVAEKPEKPKIEKPLPLDAKPQVKSDKKPVAKKRPESDKDPGLKRLRRSFLFNRDSKITSILLALLCGLSPLFMGMKPSGDVPWSVIIGVTLIALAVIYLGYSILHGFHTWKEKDPIGRKQITLWKYIISFSLCLARYLMLYILAIAGKRKVIEINNPQQLDSIVSSPFFDMDTNVYFIPEGRVMFRGPEGFCNWEGPALLAHARVSPGRHYLVAGWRTDKAIRYLKEQYEINKLFIVSCGRKDTATIDVEGVEIKYPSNYAHIESEGGILRVLQPAEGEVDIDTITRGEITIPGTTSLSENKLAAMLELEYLLTELTASSNTDEQAFTSPAFRAIQTWQKKYLAENAKVTIDIKREKYITIIFKVNRKMLVELVSEKRGQHKSKAPAKTKRSPDSSSQDADRTLPPDESKQAFRAKEGGRWMWWTFFVAVPSLFGAWWLGVPELIIILMLVFVWAMIKYVFFMDLFIATKISHKLVETRAKRTYEEANKLAREIDIALSEIDYKSEEFRTLRTSREKLKKYLVERSIFPQAADVFLDLVLSKWYRNPINWFVARWIMTHEEVEAQFKSHFMGMLGIFPIIGKGIWVLGCLIGPTISRRAKKKELHREVHPIAEFAHNKLTSDFLLNKLTEASLLEINEVSSELKLTDLERGAKMYVRIRLLKEILDNRGTISEEFKKDLKNNTIPGLRALESLTGIYPTQKMSITIRILTEDSIDFIINLLNYLTGTDISTRKDDSVLIEMPDNVYPISGLLLKRIDNLELLYVGTDLAQEQIKYFIEEIEKSFLRRRAEDAYLNRISDDSLERLHSRLLAKRRQERKPKLDYSPEDFDLIKGRIFRGGLKDIIEKALNEDFRGIRDVIKQLLFDSDVYIKEAAIKIAKEAYTDDEEIMRVVNIAERNTRTSRPTDNKRFFSGLPGHILGPPGSQENQFSHWVNMREFLFSKENPTLHSTPRTHLGWLPLESPSRAFLSGPPAGDRQDKSKGSAEETKPPSGSPFAVFKYMLKTQGRKKKALIFTKKQIAEALKRRSERTIQPNLAALASAHLILYRRVSDKGHKWHLEYTLNFDRWKQSKDKLEDALDILYSYGHTIPASKHSELKSKIDKVLGKSYTDYNEALKAFKEAADGALENVKAPDFKEWGFFVAGNKFFENYKPEGRERGCFAGEKAIHLPSGKVIINGEHRDLVVEGHEVRGDVTTIDGRTIVQNLRIDGTSYIAEDYPEGYPKRKGTGENVCAGLDTVKVGNSEYVVYVKDDGEITLLDAEEYGSVLAHETAQSAYLTLLREDEDFILNLENAIISEIEPVSLGGDSRYVIWQSIWPYVVSYAYNNHRTSIRAIDIPVSNITYNGDDTVTIKVSEDTYENIPVIGIKDIELVGSLGPPRHGDALISNDTQMFEIDGVDYELIVRNDTNFDEDNGSAILVPVRPAIIEFLADYVVDFYSYLPVAAYPISDVKISDTETIATTYLMRVKQLLQKNGLNPALFPTLAQETGPPTGDRQDKESQPEEEIEIPIIDEIDIDVSSEDTDMVGLLILEDIEGCPEGHKRVFRCRPETPKELLAAQPFGFVGAFPWQDKLASAITEKGLKKSPPVSELSRVELPGEILHVMTHRIKLTKEIEIGGQKYKEVTLLTTDEHTNNVLKKALEGPDVNRARQLISSSGVNIIDFPMAIMSDYAVGKLADALTEDKKGKIDYAQRAEITPYLISEEEATRIRREYKDDLAAKKIVEQLNGELSDMNLLAEICDWSGAWTEVKKREAESKGKIPQKARRALDIWTGKIAELEKEVKQRRQTIALEYAKERVTDEPRVAREIIITYFGARTSNAKAAGILVDTKKAIEDLDRAEREEKIQKKIDEIREILKNGLWDKAWEALNEARRLYPKEEKLDKFAIEVSETAHAGVPGHYKVLDWIPHEDRVRLTQLAKRRNALVKEQRALNEKYAKGQILKRDYDKKYDALTAQRKKVVTAFIDMLLAMHKDVWKTINKEASRRKILLRGDSEVRDWPKDQKEFETLMSYLFPGKATKKTNAPTEEDSKLPDAATPGLFEKKEGVLFPATDSIPGLDVTQRLAVGMETQKKALAWDVISIFAYVIPEFYDEKDQYKGARRRKYFAGEAEYEEEDEGALHITTVGGEEISDSVREKAKWAKEIFKKVKNSEDAQEIKELLRELYKPCIDGELSIHFLDRGGWKIYPSMVFISTLMEIGARPVFSPDEVAKFLRENPVHAKDIITSRDGQTIIRVYMGGDGIDEAVRSPVSTNGVIDIYPLRPDDKTKTLSVDEAKALIEDDNWSNTLCDLEASAWDGDDHRFYVNGIDYDFTTKESVLQLVKTVYPEEPEGGYQARLNKIWETQKNTKSEYEERSKSYPHQAHAKMDAVTRRYYCVVDYAGEVEEHFSKQGKKAEDALRYFMETIMEPEYDEIRTQTMLAGMRDCLLMNVHTINEALEEFPMSDKNYDRGIFLLRKTAQVLLEWKDSSGSGIETVRAPWEDIVAWDEEAPEQEIEEERKWRVDIWSEMINLMINILICAIYDNEPISYMYFNITDDGHVTFPHYAMIMLRIGYVPVIDRDDFIDLLSYEEACVSAEVVPSTDEYSPVLTVNLNTKKGWEFHGNLAAEKVPEGENTKFRVLLFKDNGQLVTDDGPYNELVEDGKLKVDANGTPLLATEIDEGRAKVVMIYALFDADKFFEAVVRGAKPGTINQTFAEDVMDYLRKKVVKKLEHLENDKILPRLKEARRTEDTLTKALKHERAGRLTGALKKINRGLRAEKADTKRLLKEKKRLIALISRNRVVSQAGQARKTDDIEMMRKAQRDLEIYFCGPDIEVNADIMRMMTKKDKGAFEAWQGLGVAIEKLEKQGELRVGLLGEAKQLLEEDEDFGGAIAKIEQATKYGGPSTDTHNMLTRVDNVRQQVDRFNRISSSLDAITVNIEGNALDIEDIGEFEKKLKEEVKKIEKITWKDYDEKLKKKADTVRSSIEAKKESIEKVVEERKSQIIKRIEEIKTELSQLEVPKKILALKAKVARERKDVENIPSKTVREELIQKCRNLLNTIEAKVYKIIESRAKEIPEDIDELEKEIPTCVTLEDTEALRERMGAIKRAIDKITIKAEQGKLYRIHGVVSRRLSEKHSEIESKVEREMRKIGNAINTVRILFKPSNIDASKKNLEELKEELPKIPSQEAQDKLGEKIDETKAWMNNQYQSDKKRIEQQKIIDEIEKTVEMRINAVSGWKIIGKNGMLETGATPEGLAKEGYELLDRLDTNVDISAAFDKKWRTRLDNIVADKRKDLDEAKRERDAKKPEEARQLSKDADELALTYLAERESEVSPDASLAELKQLRDSVVNIPRDIWQNLDNEERATIKEGQAAIIGTIDMLIADKGKMKKAEEKRAPGKLSSADKKRISEITDNFPSGYGKLNAIMGDLLHAKAIGDKREIEGATKRVSEVLVKMRDAIHPDDLAKYQEALKFKPSVRPGSLGGFIERTRIWKKLQKIHIGKYEPFREYSSFIHAPIFEELFKVGIPYFAYFVLSKLNPGMPVFNFVALVLLLFIFGYVYIFLHMLNESSPPENIKGIINKFKFYCDEYKHLDSETKSHIFFAPTQVAWGGIGYVSAFVLISQILFPGFPAIPIRYLLSGPLPGIFAVLLSMKMHLMVNLDVVKMRSSGKYWRFASLGSSYHSPSRIFDALVKLGKGGKRITRSEIAAYLGTDEAKIKYGFGLTILVKHLLIVKKYGMDDKAEYDVSFLDGDEVREIQDVLRRTCSKKIRRLSDLGDAPKLIRNIRRRYKDKEIKPDLTKESDEVRKEKFRSFPSKYPRIGAKDTMVVRVSEDRKVCIFGSCYAVVLPGHKNELVRIKAKRVNEDLITVTVHSNDGKIRIYSGSYLYSYNEGKEKSTSIVSLREHYSLWFSGEVNTMPIEPLGLSIRESGGAYVCKVNDPKKKGHLLSCVIPIPGQYRTMPDGKPRNAVYGRVSVGAGQKLISVYLNERDKGANRMIGLYKFTKPNKFIPIFEKRNPPEEGTTTWYREVSKGNIVIRERVQTRRSILQRRSISYAHSDPVIYLWNDAERSKNAIYAYVGDNFDKEKKGFLYNIPEEPGRLEVMKNAGTSSLDREAHFKERSYRFFYDNRTLGVYDERSEVRKRLDAHFNAERGEECVDPIAIYIPERGSFRFIEDSDKEVRLRAYDTPRETLIVFVEDAEKGRGIKAYLLDGKKRPYALYREGYFNKEDQVIVWEDFDAPSGMAYLSGEEREDLAITAWCMGYAPAPKFVKSFFRYVSGHTDTYLSMSKKEFSVLSHIAERIKGRDNFSLEKILSETPSSLPIRNLKQEIAELARKKDVNPEYNEPRKAWVLTEGLSDEEILREMGIDGAIQDYFSDGVSQNRVLLICQKAVFAETLRLTHGDTDQMRKILGIKKIKERAYELGIDMEDPAWLERGGKDVLGTTTVRLPVHGIAIDRLLQTVKHVYTQRTLQKEDDDQARARQRLQIAPWEFKDILDDLDIELAPSEILALERSTSLERHLGIFIRNEINPDQYGIRDARKYFQKNLKGKRAIELANVINTQSADERTALRNIAVVRVLTILAPHLEEDEKAEVQSRVWPLFSYTCEMKARVTEVVFGLYDVLGRDTAEDEIVEVDGTIVNVSRQRKRAMLESKLMRHAAQSKKIIFLKWAKSILINLEALSTVDRLSSLFLDKMRKGFGEACMLFEDFVHADDEELSSAYNNTVQRILSGFEALEEKCMPEQEPPEDDAAQAFIANLIPETNKYLKAINWLLIKIPFIWAIWPHERAGHYSYANAKGIELEEVDLFSKVIPKEKQPRGPPSAWFYLSGPIVNLLIIAASIAFLHYFGNIPYLSWFVKYFIYYVNAITLVLELLASLFKKGDIYKALKARHAQAETEMIQSKPTASQQPKAEETSSTTSGKAEYPPDIIRYINRAFYLFHAERPLEFSSEESKTDTNARATALELYSHLTKLKAEERLPEKIVFQEWGIGKGTFMFNFLIAFAKLDNSKEFIKRFEYQAYDISSALLNQAKKSLTELPQRYEKYCPLREFEDKVKFKQIDLIDSLPDSEIAPVWIHFNELYDDFGQVYFLERKKGKWFLVEFTPVFSPDARVGFRDLESIKRLREVKNLSEVLQSIEYKERLTPLPRALGKYLKDYLSHIEGKIKDGTRFPVNIGAFKNLIRTVDLLNVRSDGVLQIFDYGFYEKYPQRGDLFASFKREVGGHLTCALNFDFLEFMIKKYQPGFNFQILKQRDYQGKAWGYKKLPSPRLDIDYINLYQVKIFRRNHLQQSKDEKTPPTGSAELDPRMKGILGISLPTWRDIAVHLRNLFLRLSGVKMVKVRYPLTINGATVTKIPLIKGVFPAHSVNSSVLVVALEQHQIFQDVPDKKILVHGCGSGYDTLYAISKGLNKVDAIDNSALAVKNTKLALKENGLQDRVNVFLHDGLSGLGKYDIIIWNVPEPTDASKPDGMCTMSWNDFEEFLEELPHHLNKEGFAVIRISPKSRIYELFAKHNLKKSRLFIDKFPSIRALSGLAEVFKLEPETENQEPLSKSTGSDEAERTQDDDKKRSQDKPRHKPEAPWVPQDKDEAKRLPAETEDSTAPTGPSKLVFRERKLIDYGVYTEAELSNRKTLYENFQKKKDLSSLSPYDKVFIWQYMILMKLDQSQLELFKIIKSEIEKISKNCEVEGLYIGYHEWPKKLSTKDKIDTINFEKNKIEIKSGDMLLDVGCGDGAVAIGLAKAYPQAQFVAIDAHPVNISKAIDKIIEEGEKAPSNVCFHMRDCRPRVENVPNRGIPEKYGDGTFNKVLLLDGPMDEGTYQREWQLELWQEVIRIIQKDGSKIVFFGLKGEKTFKETIKEIGGIHIEPQENTRFIINRQETKYYSPIWGTTPYKKVETELYIWKLSREKPATKSKLTTAKSPPQPKGKTSPIITADGDELPRIQLPGGDNSMRFYKTPEERFKAEPNRDKVLPQLPDENTPSVDDDLDRRIAGACVWIFLKKDYNFKYGLEKVFQEIYTAFAEARKDKRDLSENELVNIGFNAVVEVVKEEIKYSDILKKLRTEDIHLFAKYTLKEFMNICVKDKKSATYKKLFGLKLLIVRHKANLTQWEFGERIGVTQSVVSAWENGECLPRPENMKEIANFLETIGSQLSYELDVTLEELLGTVKEAEEDKILISPVIEQPFLRDLSRPEELTQNMIEAVLSILLSGKKLILVFNKKIKNKEAVDSVMMLKEIEEKARRKDPNRRSGIERLLVDNFIAIDEIDSLDELRARLQDEYGIDIEKMDDTGHLLVLFAPMSEKEKGIYITIEEKENVYSSYINEGEAAYDSEYHPLSQIVVITLSYVQEQLRNVNYLMRAGDVIKEIEIKGRVFTLSTINIEKIERNRKKIRILIFTLIPEAKKYDIDRNNPYARFKELIKRRA